MTVPRTEEYRVPVGSAILVEDALNLFTVCRQRVRHKAQCNSFKRLLLAVYVPVEVGRL